MPSSRRPALRSPRDPRTTLARWALLLSAVGLSAATTACAASVCERKARFYQEQCPGTSVSFTIDPYCERKIEKCSPAQKAQMEGYVSCLEAAGVCSLDVMRACQQRYPGGVNLFCG